MREDFLQAGITALAKTTSQYKSRWFMGHLGAQVLAGYFLLNEAQLGDEIERLIGAQLDRVIDAHHDLFTPLGDDGKHSDSQPLLTQLDETVSTLSTAGHGVIYGVLGLKALLRDDSLATEAIVAGLVDLLQSCMSDSGSRYYGCDDYQKAELDLHEVGPFNTIVEAARFSLFEHEVVYANQKIDGSFYFLAGNKLHDITYAHALYDLEQLGYDDVARKGINALRRHIYLNREVKEGLQPLQGNTVYNPAKVAFWQTDVDEPHNIKLAYSVLSLLKLVDKEDRHRVLRQVSQHWERYR